MKRENTASSETRGRPRKKKSRWGQPDAKTVIPGMPAAVPAGLTDQQQKAYIGKAIYSYSLFFINFYLYLCYY